MQERYMAELKMNLKEVRTHISKSTQFDKDPRSSHNLEGRRGDGLSHKSFRVFTFVCDACSIS